MNTKQSKCFNKKANYVLAFPNLIPVVLLSNTEVSSYLRKSENNSVASFEEDFCYKMPPKCNRFLDQIDKKKCLAPFRLKTRKLKKRKIKENTNCSRNDASMSKESLARDDIYWSPKISLQDFRSFNKHVGDKTSFNINDISLPSPIKLTINSRRCTNQNVSENVVLNSLNNNKETPKIVKSKKNIPKRSPSYNKFLRPIIRKKCPCSSIQINKKVSSRVNEAIPQDNSRKSFENYSSDYSESESKSSDSSSFKSNEPSNKNTDGLQSYNNKLSQTPYQWKTKLFSFGNKKMENVESGDSLSRNELIYINANVVNIYCHHKS